jgi:hypothetical protein
VIVYPDYAGLYCRQYTPGDRRSARARFGLETAGELRATMYSGREQRWAGIDAGGPRQQYRMSLVLARGRPLRSGSHWQRTY